MKKVYVVTGINLGWNCVVGVFSEDVFLSDLQKTFPHDEYYISTQYVETNLRAYAQ